MGRDGEDAGRDTRDAGLDATRGETGGRRAATVVQRCAGGKGTRGRGQVEAALQNKQAPGAEGIIGVAHASVHVVR